MRQSLQLFKPAFPGQILLTIGFAYFIGFYLLVDKNALTSSIYTYYFNSYYTPVSSGKIPWISFNFEYPPFAAYALLFPGLFAGLSVLSLGILRGLFSYISSLILIITFARSPNQSPATVQIGSVTIGLLSIITPGFFFGLFDWYLLAINVIIAILISENRLSKIWKWIAFGTSIKLMPILAIPFLFKQINENKSHALKALTATAFVHLPFIIFGFQGMRYFIAYHRLRSIDTFSSYACILNTIEHFRDIGISRVWAFGTIEVQSQFAFTMAKISLPLFAVFLCGLIYFHKSVGGGPKAGFAIYSSAVVLYTVISKVSQQNYVVWIIASIVSVWFVGYSNKDFVKKTFFIAVLLMAIAFFQDRFFDDLTYKVVPWRMILACSIRHILSLVLVYLFLREIKTQQLSLTETKKVVLTQ